MALGAKIQIDGESKNSLGPKIQLDEVGSGAPSFIDQVANAGLGAVDALGSLAGQAISFPASLAYEAAGHLTGQGKDVAKQWGQIPGYYTQPGMITGTVRSLAGLPSIPQEQTMAARYSEPIAKTFETLIPSQQIEEGLGRAKELGAPEKVTDALAFGASKFIELMAFGGYHKIATGAIGKVKGKLKEYQKAPTPQAQGDLLGELEGVLGKLNEKGVDTMELRSYIPNISETEFAKIQDTPVPRQTVSGNIPIEQIQSVRDIEARNTQLMQRTNAESQRFMQSRSALQQALKANVPKPESPAIIEPKQTGLTPQETLEAAKINVNLTGDPKIISMEEYKTLLEQEQLAKIPTQENVSAKLEAMRAEAKAQIMARSKIIPEPVKNTGSYSSAVSEEMMQQIQDGSVPVPKVTPEQIEKMRLDNKTVQDPLPPVKRQIINALEYIDPNKKAGADIPIRQQQEAARTNQIASEAVSRQRTLQQMLQKGATNKEVRTYQPPPAKVEPPPVKVEPIVEPTTDAAIKQQALMNEVSKTSNNVVASVEPSADIDLYHGGFSKWETEPGFPNGRPRLDKVGTGIGETSRGEGWYGTDSESISKTFSPDGKNLYKLKMPKEVADTLIDFDKPLSEQNQKVKSIAEKNNIPIEAQIKEGSDIVQSGPFKGIPFKEDLSGYYVEMFGGQKTYIKLDPEFTGHDFYNSLSQKLGSDKLASEYLAKEGILGNKHKGTSRGPGDYNYYVIWDQATLDSMAKKSLGGKVVDEPTSVQKMNIVSEPELKPQSKLAEVVEAKSPTQVPEFTTHKEAKQSYELNKRQFATVDEAKTFYDTIPQEIRDEFSPEVLKVGKKYRIGTKILTEMPEEEIVAKIKDTVKELGDIDQGRDVPIPKMAEQMTGEQVYKAVTDMIPEIQAALQNGTNVEVVHQKLASLGDHAATSLEFELLDKIESMLPQLWKKKMEIDSVLEQQFSEAHKADMKSAKTTAKGKEIKVDASGYNGVSVRDIKNTATAINKIVGNIGAVGPEVGGGKQSRLSLLNQAEIDSIRRVKEAAQKAGKEIGEFLLELGMTRENAQKIVETIGEMGEEKVGRKELRSTPEQLERATAGLESEMEKIRDPIKRYYQEMYDKRQMVDTYRPGDGNYQRQLPGTPQTPPELSGKAMGNTALSPHNVLNVFKSGDNPVTDVIKSHNAFTRNVSNGKKWIKDLLKDVPEMSPEAQKKFENIYDQYSDRYKLRAQIGRSVASLEKRIAKKSGEQKAALEKELKIEQAKFGEANKMAKDMAADFDTLINSPESPALTEPTVRIMLAADGTLPKHIQLSPLEADVAAKIRTYFDSTAEDMKALGMPTKEGYVHRVWKPLVNKDVLESSFFQRSMRTPSMLRQMSQLPDGRTWFPDAKATLESYVPIIERELAYNPFLDRWSSFIDKTESPKLRAYMQQWVNDNLYRKPDSFMGNVNAAATAFEFARLIGLSLPVAFKHLMKVWGTTSQNSLDVNALALADTMKALGQFTKEKFGGIPKDKELEVFRSYVTTRDIVKSLDESPLHGMLDMVKGILGSPTATIEAFDNGISVFSAIRKGAKKGIDSQTTERAMIRTILDVNFRSGWDQPLWLKTDAARWMLMFQSTPYKSAELKYQMVKRALNNERDAFGTHYGQQLLKYVLTIGAVEAIARANDTSVLEQVMHMPFFSHWLVGTKEQPGVKLHMPKSATSPLVGLAYKMSSNKRGALAGAQEQFGLDRNFLPTQRSSPSLDRYVRAAEGNKRKFNTITQMILGLRPLEEESGGR